jgi:hypothetical protein
MMIMLLSPLAILFNDPFYLITITRPNQLNNFFSVMFIINLFAYLFLFWITILDVKNYIFRESIYKIQNIRVMC